MFEIIPGILEKDWASIEAKIKLIKPFTKSVQIDVIDGIFSPNITFLDPEPFKKYTKELFFEVQLITDEPINYIEKFAKAGFKRFIGQIEKMSSQKEFIKYGKKFGEVGLAIDADTTVDEIEIDLNSADCFTLMSVKAGFSGQAFLPNVLDKIKAIKQKTTKPIEIDGGVNEKTIKQLKNLNVERYIVNSALFNTNDIASQYQKFLELVS